MKYDNLKISFRTPGRSPKPKNRQVPACCVLIICAICLFSSVAWARSNSKRDKLYSPSIALKFYDIGYELAGVENANEADIEQALGFFMATIILDQRASYALDDMIRLYSALPWSVNSQADALEMQKRNYMVNTLLTNYVDKQADLEVTGRGIKFMLDQLNSREERERVLSQMIQTLGPKNAMLNSQLCTLLGLLQAEKADINTAAQLFMVAYNSNRYNRIAFKGLIDIIPEQLTEFVYLEQMRLSLSQNPIDIEAAISYANYLEQLQLYELAAQAYKYCADVFAYLYPSEPLPATIYLPWMISTYNTQRNQHDCLQIVELVRKSGQFNLLAETIAAKAAEKTGNTNLANTILKNAEKTALADYQTNLEDQLSLVWFYCFGLVDPNNALDVANKVYSAEPNSIIASSLLAYALVMNRQIDFAEPLLENYQRNQIADLAMAKIQLSKGQTDKAIETLKIAIEKDPGSLEAQQAKLLLFKNNSEYITPIAVDIIQNSLTETFGNLTVPSFLPPEQIISVQLNTRGSKFSYGKEIDAAVAITNISPEPLVINDESMFKGNLRIDANVTGDINKYIPNLVTMKIQPSQPIKSNNSFTLPVQLVTGQLAEILLKHPQASLNIEFTVFIDPVTGQGLGVVNRLADSKPATTAITRPAVKITGKFLQNKLNALAKGRVGQKTSITQLVIGLLAEQDAMANREPLYEFVYADWMPEMLKSALLYILDDDDWVVKTQAMSDMVSLPLDYELLNAVSENLNDTHWPSRMMALYLLAKQQGSDFAKVLDWHAKHDPEPLVVEMAVTLGAAKPQPRQQPNQGPTNNSQKTSDQR